MKALNYYALIAAANGAVLLASLIYWMARVALSSPSSASAASEIQEIPSDYSEDESARTGQQSPINLNQTRIIHHSQAPVLGDNDDFLPISVAFDSALDNRVSGSVSSSVKSLRHGRNSEENQDPVIASNPSSERGIPLSASSIKTLVQSDPSTASEKVKKDLSAKRQVQPRANQPSSSRSTSAPKTNLPATVVRPIIVRRPQPREPPNVDHVQKSNSRINMSFDNKRFWDISSANQNLAHKIQNIKPTYSRVPEQPKFLRSRLELKQTTGFFTLQRDNTRIANRIMLAKPTVPSARAQSASRLPSRPSSSLSQATFDIPSRPQSGSKVPRARQSWNL